MDEIRQSVTIASGEGEFDDDDGDESFLGVASAAGGAKPSGSGYTSSAGFEISFLKDAFDRKDEESYEEVTEYCVGLIKARFTQFIEYLDRSHQLFPAP